MEMCAEGCTEGVGVDGGHGVCMEGTQRNVQRIAWSGVQRVHREVHEGVCREVHRVVQRDVQRVVWWVSCPKQKLI